VLLWRYVFAVNLAETRWETSRHTDQPVVGRDYRGAYAVPATRTRVHHFEFHDKTPNWVILRLLDLVLRPVSHDSRSASDLARAAPAARAVQGPLPRWRDYLVSLPWFLLFPVPERWATRNRTPILLSDTGARRSSTRYRPLSAVNNSFPSTHSVADRDRHRRCAGCFMCSAHTVTALGMMVILATSCSASTGSPTS
jgi:hypothetical protein